ncbi:pyruvate:ferredoxin (flavodoxin) oxidoreductase [Clostridium felsineum]|uniref:pyruvate:ferredoxin (flavodoxin) oxidoreductase n=1 Tax=Clostridium felsineum TaxID=36839 RepID=UPI00098C421F|nr:pyruvate:ferredoxin (flavodoxin) oxidoreductase [Clostridium felsineum]MCR3757751.1 pyruvate:ferredoxin (flavodoxin) oxidoreductase [Clostridium felsineum]URZ01001.1 Pyruvate:ferredoxin oxidoreductase [Clostridium felsineum]
MKKMKTMDGNTAAAHISYAFTDVAAIYPITPSSPMAEHVDEWATQGRKNLFGQKVKIMEMQSEAGAAGAVHGSLQAGALTTTYTASQGMLLMVPNMYKIAGELLPGVFHVSARALATHSLNIYGDHQDVMAARQTGCALLAEGSVQEVMDLSAVAHLVAIKGRVPFINFFDGFRTSHEIQKVEVMDYEDLRGLLDMDAVNAFRRNALNPDHPVQRGSNEGSDIYFQGKEAQNKFYNALPEMVEHYMGEISKITGREYHLFNYYGAEDADRVIIAMGSICDTIEETIDYLRAKGEKVGVLKVHLYRPFSVEHFLKYIPKTAKKIAVLDRTKEAGSQAEPLYLDVVKAFYNSDVRPVIVGGRFGLGLKDTLPVHIYSVYENLKADAPKDGFTIGINDDVTHTSLPVPEIEIDTTPEGTKTCKFWGLGSDGTVGANKSAIKIIGDHTSMYAQGYFAYDSKKSGGITVSHLRFGKKEIKSPYLIDKADFIACHNQSYVYKYDVLAGLKKGGNFLLNTIWTPEEIEEKLPAEMKRYIAKNDINFYTLNAVKIAQAIGLGGRVNMICQAAFFKIANIIPVEDAVKYLKDAVVTNYGKKGQKVVDMNNAAIDQGVGAIVKIDVPAAWTDAKDAPKEEVAKPKFITDLLEPINRQEGDKLPVSAFEGKEDGTYPLGTAAYEKRGIAINVPEWDVDKCIQCNQCSFVCPHAVIRPALMNAEETKNAPEGMKYKKAMGVKSDEELNFSIVISPLDCTGCGNCAEVCPAKEKALVMKPAASEYEVGKYFDYATTLKERKEVANKYTVKGSQFSKPLLEFNGACAGCGEASYAKLITQLFGDRMMVSNATGCTSIWGCSAPSMPYTTNAKGQGPAWANSLFEDNAEYGMGMLLGTTQLRERLADLAKEAINSEISAELKAVLQDWLENIDNGETSRAIVDKLLPLLEKERNANAALTEMYTNKDYLAKRSQWIFGGDGWAYDIGYGGVDHVLASGEDINIFVFDTEVYSNTGGQSSKSTPASAIAQFAAAGKTTKKKDLGMMAMSYGYVYVAQIAMGADKNQTLKAIKEAENYHGPSLIIAYSPCINHGLKAGMGCSQLEQKKAVDCGYWALYRFNPLLKEEGKNPFSLDSKEPTGNFKEFLLGEVRYASLKKVFPDKAEELYAKTEKDAMERLESYKRLADR